MKNYFTISQISMISGVSIQAIRLYEKMNLIKPKYTDPKTNYRYYDLDNLIYINLIKSSKILKIPLKNLKPVFEKNDINQLIRLLENQKKILDHEIEKLFFLKEELNRSVDKLRLNESISHLLEPYWRDFTVRNVIFKDVDYSQRSEEIELGNRLLEKKLESDGIKVEGDYGFFLSKNRFLLERRRFAYQSFVTVKDPLNREDFASIPAGTYLCFPYKFKEKDKMTTTILQYLREHQIHFEVLLDIQYWGGHFISQREIQLLVHRKIA